MSKKLKVLVTAQPIVTHVRPLEPVTRLAMSRGHDVRFAVPPKMQRLARVEYKLPVGEAGPMGVDWTESDAVQRELSDLLINQGNEAFCHVLYGKYMVGEAALPMARDIVAMAQAGWKPDLIFHDVSEHGAYLAGQFMEVPTVSMDNGLGRQIWEEHRRTIRPVLTRLRRRMGLPEEPKTPGSFRGMLTTRAPRDFLFQGLDIPTLSPYRHINPIRRGDTLPDWVKSLPKGRPFVYVMLGSSGWTVPAFKPLFEQANRLVLKALGNLDCEVLVAVGPGNSGAYRNVAPNIHVVDYAAQPMALALANLFVGHGGYGGLCEAILGSTPMVLLPQFADQQPNAEQVVKQGLGLMLNPRTATPEQVAQACLTVLNGRQFHGNMAKMNAAMKQLPSLEELLANRLARFGF